MNKQELIKRIECLFAFGSRDYIERNEVLGLVRQLDEPQKVQMPQCVADWIKVAKPVYSLSGAMVYGSPGVNKWLENWDNQDLFARAWLDGYEVEREKQYKVVMPNISSTGGVLTRIKHNDSWIWIDTIGTIVEGRTHTSKELEEAGFGWVFDCPGIEVEEVGD
jgi:hypothetical protein